MSCWVLGREGEFDTGTGVALVTPNTLQAAVVVDVADAGGTDVVHFSMGELCAFHIHFNLLCRGKRKGKEGASTICVRTCNSQGHSAELSVTYGDQGLFRGRQSGALNLGSKFTKPFDASPSGPPTDSTGPIWELVLNIKSQPKWFNTICFTLNQKLIPSAVY